MNLGRRRVDTLEQTILERLGTVDIPGQMGGTLFVFRTSEDIDVPIGAITSGGVKRGVPRPQIAQKISDWARRVAADEVSSRPESIGEATAYIMGLHEDYQ
jgi:hypothetical protein